MKPGSETSRLCSLLPFRRVALWLFADDIRCRSRSGTADGERAFAQRVEHPQLFCDRLGGERVPVGALAFQNPLEIEGHVRKGRR